MAWIAEAFAGDAEALALSRALPASLSSGSSPSSAALLRRNRSAPASGRIAKAKRKPRGGAAANRSPVTYIIADPANFLEMVQRVTGAEGLEPSASPAPVPPRQQIRLPTLDTSELFLGQLDGGAFGLPTVSSNFDSLFPVFPMPESWSVM
ncbi:calmodulin-binding protein 25-like [Zingiber officinale]|uniref:calmodulin-binding protein 25-like n=1 Tax=Zingiber officinale TaxID=94328 RepID=UPI001C4A765D|nr:calmodulin-binding protein 25-like [Zingiber officinale]